MVRAGDGGSEKTMFVHKVERGIKNVQKSVHMIYDWPHILNVSTEKAKQNLYYMADLFQIT